MNRRNFLKAVGLTSMALAIDPLAVSKDRFADAPPKVTFTPHNTGVTFIDMEFKSADLDTGRLAQDIGHVNQSDVMISDRICKAGELMFLGGSACSGDGYWLNTYRFAMRRGGHQTQIITEDGCRISCTLHKSTQNINKKIKEITHESPN